MDKKLLIIILVIFIAALGIFLFSKQYSEVSIKPEQSSSTDLQSDQAKSSISDSRYLTFAPEILSTNSNLRRVLFFYADWCPTCRPADEDFRLNSDKIPEDVIVIRVNYNDTETDQDERDLAEKYGVTYQHTYVQIDENGQEVAKWNGGSIDNLLSNIK